MTPQSKRRWLLVMGGLLVVAALAVFAHRPLGEALRLLAHADPTALREYLQSFGVWAPIVSFVLMLLQAIVAPLPSAPITYVNGLVFGTWLGALLSWVSALVGAAVCFGISRALGRAVAERLVGRRAVEWSDGFFVRYGAYAVLIGRLIPLISFDAISYGAGLTRVSFTGFVVATGLGMIPATLALSYLGDLGGASASAFGWTIAALLLAGLLAVVGKRVLDARIARLRARAGD